jgi:hypothetical protein
MSTPVVAQDDYAVAQYLDQERRGKITRNLVIGGAAVALLAIGIVAALLIIKAKKTAQSSSSSSETPHEFDDPEVFLYYDAENLVTNLEEAENACFSINGSRVATYAELHDEAYDHGAQWCSGGFVTDGNSYYPMQESDPDCGNTVGLVMFGNDGDAAGATCIGIKPVPDTTGIIPWNGTKWSRWSS